MNKYLDKKGLEYYYSSTKLIAGDGIKLDGPKKSNGLPAGITISATNTTSSVNWDNIQNKPGFKTINNESIFGSGNIEISGGDGCDCKYEPANESATVSSAIGGFNKGTAATSLKGKTFSQLWDILLFGTTEEPEVIEPSITISGISATGSYTEGDKVTIKVNFTQGSAGTATQYSLYVDDEIYDYNSSGSAFEWDATAGSHNIYAAVAYSGSSSVESGTAKSDVINIAVATKPTVVSPTATIKILDSTGHECTELQTGVNYTIPVTYTANSAGDATSYELYVNDKDQGGNTGGTFTYTPRESGEITVYATVSYAASALMIAGTVTSNTKTISVSSSATKPTVAITISGIDDDSYSENDPIYATPAYTANDGGSATKYTMYVDDKEVTFNTSGAQLMWANATAGTHNIFVRVEYSKSDSMAAGSVDSSTVQVTVKEIEYPIYVGYTTDTKMSTLTLSDDSKTYLFDNAVELCTVKKSDTSIPSFEMKSVGTDASKGFVWFAIPCFITVDTSDGLGIPQFASENSSDFEWSLYDSDAGKIQHIETMHKSITYHMYRSNKAQKETVKVYYIKN